VRRGGGLVAVGVAVGVGRCVGHDSSPWGLNLPFLSPGRAKKRHSFHSCEFGRSEALSTPKPEGARKRARRFMPRGAAQAGWTEGAERSL
jgi:hypothetical protein